LETVVVPLTTNQTTVAKQIAQYGVDHGFSNADIQIALKTADIESTLGNNLQNPTSTANGLFGYTSPDWNSYHSGVGERSNNANQIQAFYDDLNRYHARYDSLTPAQKDAVTFEQYAYIKHHDGPNYTDFANAPGKDIWDHHDFQVPDGIMPAPTPPSNALKESADDNGNVVVAGTDEGSEAFSRPGGAETIVLPDGIAAARSQAEADAADHGELPLLTPQAADLMVDKWGIDDGRWLPSDEMIQQALDEARRAPNINANETIPASGANGTRPDAVQLIHAIDAQPQSPAQSNAPGGLLEITMGAAPADDAA